jgi:predicted nucleic acid-binding Zn ribbon protein
VSSGEHQPLSISDSLTSLVRGLKDDPSLQRKATAAPTSAAALGGVFGRWEEAVGPAVASNVRPVRVDGDVLTVEVSDPAWATQLTFLEDSMRARLAEVVGFVASRIDVRVARRRS